MGHDQTHREAGAGVEAGVEGGVGVGAGVGGEPSAGGDSAGTVVEFTDSGYVRVSAELAARWFPGDSLVAIRRGHELWLLPLVGHQAGGILLKQRNARGDRAALVWEALDAGTDAGETPPTGPRSARWDDGNGALRVDLRS